MLLEQHIYMRLYNFGTPIYCIDLIEEHKGVNKISTEYRKTPLYATAFNGLSKIVKYLVVDGNCRCK